MRMVRRGDDNRIYFSIQFGKHDSPVVVTLHLWILLHRRGRHIVRPRPKLSRCSPINITEAHNVMACKLSRMLVHPVIPIPIKAIFSLSLGGNHPARPSARDGRIVNAPTAPAASTSRRETFLGLIAQIPPSEHQELQGRKNGPLRREQAAHSRIAKKSSCPATESPEYRT